MSALEMQQIGGVDEQLINQQYPGEYAGHGGGIGDAVNDRPDEETGDDGYDGVPPYAASEHEDEHAYSADGGNDRGDAEKPFGALTIVVVVLKDADKAGGQNGVESRSNEIEN